MKRLLAPFGEIAHLIMLSDSADNEDVTHWVSALSEGDESSAAKLWEHCMPRLRRYAKSRLPANLLRSLDEEDVALSAFKSLYQLGQRGGLENIDGRESLWKLLMCITARKATAHVRSETREKRGGGKVRGESIYTKGRDGSGGLHEAAGNLPTPDLAVEFEDECRNLLDALDDDTLRTIALLRLDGHTVDEIASRIGCAKRSVERRLNLIRKIWEDHLDIDR
ncbi:MAG: ECF-type sigma factor [Aureliella sp.]